MKYSGALIVWAIWMIVLLVLTGCTTSSDRIGDIRQAAEDCPGKVKLEVKVTSRDETIRFKCEWENPPEPVEQPL